MLAHASLLMLTMRRQKLLVSMVPCRSSGASQSLRILFSMGTVQTQNEGCACGAEKAIASGGEILHSYGRLSNAQLLLTYGFVPVLPEGVSNPNDRLPIPVADIISCCERPAAQVSSIHHLEIADVSGSM